MGSKTFLLLLVLLLISWVAISARDLSDSSAGNKDDAKGAEEGDDHPDRYSTHGGFGGGFGGPWGGYGGQWGGYGGPWGGYGGPGGGYGGQWGWYGGGYGGRWGGYGGKGWFCRYGRCVRAVEVVKTENQVEPHN